MRGNSVNELIRGCSVGFLTFEIVRALNVGQNKVVQVHRTLTAPHRQNIAFFATFICHILLLLISVTHSGKKKMTYNMKGFLLIKFGGNFNCSFF